MIYTPTNSNFKINWKWGKYKPYYDKIFTDLGVKEVQTNSVYRQDTTTHSSGNSIDIHGLKFKDGAYLVFHHKNHLYNKTQNEIFLTRMIAAFNKYGLNFSFYSPEILYKNHADTMHKKNNKITSLENTHLDHMHININSLKAGYLPNNDNKPSSLAIPALLTTLFIIHKRKKK